MQWDLSETAHRGWLCVAWLISSLIPGDIYFSSMRSSLELAYFGSRASFLCRKTANSHRPLKSSGSGKLIFCNKWFTLVNKWCFKPRLSGSKQCVYFFSGSNVLLWWTHKKGTHNVSESLHNDLGPYCMSESSEGPVPSLFLLVLGQILFFSKAYSLAFCVWLRIFPKPSCMISGDSGRMLLSVTRHTLHDNILSSLVESQTIKLN